MIITNDDIIRMIEERCIMCGGELLNEKEREMKICDSCYCLEVCPEAILGGVEG